MRHELHEFSRIFPAEAQAYRSQSGGGPPHSKTLTRTNERENSVRFWTAAGEEQEAYVALEFDALI